MSRNRKISKKGMIYIPNQEMYSRQTYFDITSDNAFRNASNFQKKQEQLKRNKK